ncbi:hypothetical protein [Agrobacterium tumefaciens]|uniref:Uncharacterized protein n=1 Tax=Agrobacterium tumefaciens TaxID=358 RepID=A0AA44JBW7_AGRTU|nr:hypothetical protein [Agrobacterium tumefaciens]NSL20194.1 hypothetical protein [Agrobacterium tumefaciens]NTB88352.1 hypothetical protein [Agrobacterium tumefaciens]NTC18398.1 hypothetical protein [Agrobacterium tumefaciens]NTC32156.1 hypothetical protein [Agrobacterium tumefaciens]NTC54661.1 hypothetical protein [Agrobacterium tumefaciens]
MRFQWGTLLGIILAVAIGGLVSTYVVGSVTFVADGSTKLTARLQEMALLALVIERAVEVYLRVANQNGPDQNDPNTISTTQQSASQVTTFVALIVGVLVAVLDVRLMDSFVSFSSTTWLPNTLLNGVDVLISGALLAGVAVISFIRQQPTRR